MTTTEEDSHQVWLSKFSRLVQKLLRLIDPHAWSGKALLAVVAWGASFVATRLALESFAPLELVTARIAAGSLVLV
ncbi:MAG: hypothetical protein AB1486_10525 [Planctomycetota bacterium]